MSPTLFCRRPAVSTRTTSASISTPARHGVEGDGRRVSSFTVRAHRGHADPLAPRLQLVGGGGPEGVGAAEHDVACPARRGRGPLADRRRLAGAVDTDDEDAGRSPVDPRGDERAVHRRVDEGEQLLSQPVPHGGLVGRPVDGDPRAQRVDELGRRPDAEVGGEEGVLHLLPCGLVQAPAGEQGQQPLAECGVRPGQAGAQAARRPPAPRGARASGWGPGWVVPPRAPAPPRCRRGARGSRPLRRGRVDLPAGPPGALLQYQRQLRGPGAGSPGQAQADARRGRRGCRGRRPGTPTRCRWRSSGHPRSRAAGPDSRRRHPRPRAPRSEDAHAVLRRQPRPVALDDGERLVELGEDPGGVGAQVHRALCGSIARSRLCLLPAADPAPDLRPAEKNRCSPVARRSPGRARHRGRCGTPSPDGDRRSRRSSRRPSARR